MMKHTTHNSFLHIIFLRVVDMNIQIPDQALQCHICLGKNKACNERAETLQLMASASLLTAMPPCPINNFAFGCNADRNESDGMLLEVMSL